MYIFDKNKQSKDNSILIILDDCDHLIKTSNNQFFLLINSLDLDQTYFILTTNKEISSPNLPCEKIPISSLEKEEEDIYLFLNLCKRNIDKREIDLRDISSSQVEEKNLIDLLKRSMTIKKCGGVPKYIKMLADRCSTISLKYIKTDFLDEMISEAGFLECLKDINKTYTSPNSFNIIAKLRQVETNRSSKVNSSVNSPNTSINKGKKNNNFHFPSTVTQTVFYKKSNEIYKKLSGIEEKEEEAVSRKESKKDSEPIIAEPENNRIVLHGINSLQRQKSESLDVIVEETSIRRKDSRLNIKGPFIRDSRSKDNIISRDCPFIKSPETGVLSESNETRIIENKLNRQYEDDECVEPPRNNMLLSSKNITGILSKQRSNVENISPKKDNNGNINMQLSNILNKFGGKSIKFKIQNNTFERCMEKKAQSDKQELKKDEEIELRTCIINSNIVKSSLISFSNRGNQPNSNS